MSDDTKHTRNHAIRVPDPLWEAFGRVVQKLDTSRSARLLDHMRADVRQHGDEDDLLALDQAEKELAERRARKGGRPKGT